MNESFDEDRSRFVQASDKLPRTERCLSCLSDKDEKTNKSAPRPTQVERWAGALADLSTDGLICVPGLRDCGTINRTAIADQLGTKNSDKSAVKARLTQHMG